MITKCEFVMIEIRRSPKTIARLRERITKGLCIAKNEDGTDCDRKAKALGVCDCHLRRAKRREEKLKTISAKRAFRNELLRQGFMLEPQEVREFKSNDLYAKIAESVEG